MKKNDATRIRLDETERRKLEEIAAITGLPISACIRALIAAFIADFEKNRGTVSFPIKMDAPLHIRSAQKKLKIESEKWKVGYFSTTEDTGQQTCAPSTKCHRRRESIN